MSEHDPSRNILKRYNLVERFIGVVNTSLSGGLGFVGYSHAYGLLSEDRPMHIKVVVAGLSLVASPLLTFLICDGIGSVVTGRHHSLFQDLMKSERDQKEIQ